MKPKILFLSLFLVGASFLYAQHPNVKAPDVEEVMVVSAEMPMQPEIINAFVQNSPLYFNAPSAPRFAIIGKKHSFYLGITGYAKGTASYDFGSPIDNTSLFTTSQIPMSMEPGNGGLVQMGANTSTLAFNFVGMPTTKNKIGAYISFNFLNSNYSPNLLDAYVTYRGIKVGYTTSLYTDAQAGPPTIDYEGPGGFTFIRNAVANYTYTFNAHWSAAIGLESPMASYTTDNFISVVNQRIPDIPAYVQYAWGQGSSWVRLSGMLRNMNYYDRVKDHLRTRTAWGAKLSGSAVLGKFTAYYQAAYGFGVSSYLQDIEGMQLDMVPDMEAVGRLSNVESLGAYFGLQYNITKRLFVSATYSKAKVFMPHHYYQPDQYSNADYVAANLFYNITPVVQVGAEYLWGQRMNQNDATAHTNRLQAMLQVTF